MKSSKFLRKIFQSSLTLQRNLLKECSQTADLTPPQARKLLQSIVGSPKNFGDPSSGTPDVQPTPKSQSELPERRMLDSYREVIIPLGKDQTQREKYLQTSDSVRFGRIFEDLDTMAVLIGYSHNLDPVKGTNQKSPISIVTAMVDSLKTHTDQISHCKDIFIRGHVTWVGSSSMEISMSVEQEHNGVLNQVIAANFLMVARDPVSKRKAFVNPLAVSTPEETALFELGNANKKARSLQSQISVLKIPPSDTERMIIHDIFLKTMDPKSGILHDVIPPPNTIWMSEAGLKNVIHCFPQQRNLYNKVFGGYLMRKALELAHANATAHCKSYANLKYVDDISFQQPVEIGSFLYLSSRIVYTVRKLLQLRVHAQVLNPLTGEFKTTNTFQFTFSTANDFPTVMPRTYAEYLLYIEGKRHLENHM